MNPEEIIGALNILSEYFNTVQVQISDSVPQFFIVTENLTNEAAKLTELGINSDLDGTELKIRISDFIGINPKIHPDWKLLHGSNILNDCVVLNPNGNYCYFNSETSKTYFNNNAPQEFQNECNNAFSYYLLYNFLKSDKFADHHNSLNREIVLYSTINGVFKINYPALPKFSSTEDFSKSISQLLEYAKPKQLHQFFKNAFFEQNRGSIFIDEIVRNAHFLTESATRNFDIVSKQFNFENFRNSLNKEKEKYFANIREVANKIFAQAAGIPISIGATAFATYKVEDDPILLLLVLATFAIYVYYYIKIQLFYKAEITVVEEDFTRDFEQIRADSGLSQSEIDREKKKVLKKIKEVKSILSSLINVIIILGIFATIYIVYEIINVDITVSGLLKLILFSLS